MPRIKPSVAPQRAPALAPDALVVSAQDIVNTSPLAAAAFDEQGQFVCANAIFDEEFQSLGQALSQHDWLAHFEAVDAPNTEAAVLTEYFCPLLKRWFRIHRRGLVCRAAGLNGNHTHLCVLIVQNISERLEAISLQKSQHEKLLLTSRMMSVGEMTSTLAHELNQPLASIVNYLSTALRLVEKIDSPPTRLKDALFLGRQQAERAAAVVQRLREFVRKREPKRVRMALLDTATTVLRMLDLEIKKFRVRTEIEIPAMLPEVYADRVMIEQVTFNLVKNAMEAMREVALDQRSLRIRGRITLDGDVELSVIDRGTGFDSGSEQIFSPFFTTKSDGMGIGLSICRSIIEYHQGRIFFDSNPDGGAIFGFRLPIAADEVSA
jgi:signal transduction histidine kinase